jgi:hypothetical protein
LIPEFWIIQLPVKQDFAGTFIAQQQDLMEDWQLCMNKQQLNPIEPLK